MSCTQNVVQRERVSIAHKTSGRLRPMPSDPEATNASRHSLHCVLHVDVRSVARKLREHVSRVNWPRGQPAVHHGEIRDTAAG